MYKCYLTNAPIFWENGGENKPSFDYFKNWNEQANWIDLKDLTPNFLSQFNASIVVDKKEYTMVKMEDLENGKITYWSIEGINSIFGGGEELHIVLDIYLSYVMDLFEIWKKQNLTLDILRTHTKDTNLLKNAVLNIRLDNNLIIANDTQYTYVKGLALPFERLDAYTNKYPMRYGDNTYMLMEHVWDSGLLYKDNLYLVLQNPKYGGYIIVPIIYKLREGATSINLKGYGDLNIDKKSEGYTIFYNYDSYIWEKIVSNTNYVNQIVGIYYGLPWQALEGYESSININGNILNNILNIKLSTLQDRNLVLPSLTPLFENFDTKYYYDINGSDIEGNYIVGLVNSYKMGNELDNNSIFLFQEYLDDSTPNLSYAFVNGGFNLYYNQFQLKEQYGYNFQRNTITMPQMLPFSIDAYTKYQSSIESGQNFAIKAANIRMSQGMVNALIGGTMGKAEGAAMAIGGNPVGGIVKGVKSGVGMVQNIFASLTQNLLTRQQISSFNEDNKRQLQASNNPSSLEDFNIYKLTSNYYKSSLDYHFKFIRDLPTTLSNVRMNRYLFLYGTLINAVININACFTMKYYNFIAIKQDWLISNLKTYFKNTNASLLNAIKEELSLGMRICNVEPDYMYNEEHQINSGE